MTETDDDVVIFNCGGVDFAGQFTVTVENLSLILIS